MATIKDVAERAQVSVATVSYVINRKGNVSKELLERVNKAIEELNYRPSGVARSLRTGKTMNIGLLIDDISNQFGAEFTIGLIQTAREKGYDVLISSVYHNIEEEYKLLDRFLLQRVDGIIYGGYGATEAKLLEIEASGIPVVAVDKPLQSREISSVLIDNRQAIFMAVEYLIRLGHRSICYLAGFIENRNTRIRVEAFRDCLREYGINFDDDSIIYGDYTLEHGYQSVMEMVDVKKYTALLCGDDMVAFGAIAALKQRGVRVPEEMAVIGFDNVPLSAFFDPTLTTVNYPMREMGSKAFELLYERIKKRRKRAQHLLLSANLVVRQSTGGLPYLEAGKQSEEEWNHAQV